MINRKTIMFLALLGTYAAHAAQQTPEERFAARMQEEYATGATPTEEYYTVESPRYGTYSVSAEEYPAGAFGRVSARRQEEAQQAAKPKQPSAKRSEKANMEKSIQKAEKEEGTEVMCAVAARFGRSLKALPKSRGLITKEKLAKKCNKFFQDNNHPKAYEAVNGKAMAS